MRLTLSILAATLALTASPLLAQPQSAPRAAAPAQPIEIVPMDPAFARLVAPGTQVETLAVIPGAGLEGPLWRKGALRVSDERGGSLYEVSRDGRYRVLEEKAGGPIDPKIRAAQGPNGQASWRKGTVVVARQGLRDLGVTGPDGKLQSLVAAYEGKRFNSPNDMTVGRDGTVWFTDPPFNLPGYDRTPGAAPPSTKEIPFNGVFRLKDGKLAAVVTDLAMPNGVALSPDGRILYVNNSLPERYVRAYAVSKAGELSNQRDFARFGDDSPLGRGAPDGMKVDARGNVWTTGPGGVVVIAPSGKVLGQIRLPAHASNLAFGDDYKTVFITSGPNIYRLRTLVKGQIPPFAER